MVEPERTAETAAAAPGTASAASPSNPTIAPGLGLAETPGQSAGDQASAAAVKALRFNLLRNIDYHGARESWFARWDRSFRFLSVFSSLGAVTSLLTSAGWVATALITVTASLQALDLVFDFARQAREARGLRQRLYALLAEIERTNPSAEKAHDWQGALTLIYGDEPPPLMALDARAWNNTVARTKAKFSKDELIPLSDWQTWTRHVWSWHGLDSRTLGERKLVEQSEAHA